MTKPEFKKSYGITFSEKMTGKMSGMIAITTSCIDNPICRERAKNPDSICSKCYAERYLNIRPSVRKCYERNYNALTADIIPVKDWPVLNARAARIESFGDLANWIQAANYINLATANPGTVFGWWTKNPGYIATAIKKGYKIPKNAIIIYGNPYVDRFPSDSDILSRWPFVNKVFSVFSKDFADRENVTINCGSRNCLTCGRCYSKRTGFHVNEILK